MTELLTTSLQLRRALRRIGVQRAAVAFVGRHWTRYLPDAELTQFILSPTLGSNPAAIRELLRRSRIEVLFLDRLHSKVYVGSGGVCVGSCNLSSRALGDGGSLEAAVLCTRRSEVSRMHRLLDAYRKEAEKAYPTLGSKLRRVEALEAERRRARVAGIDLDDIAAPDASDATSPQLQNFMFDAESRLHIAWWMDADLRFVDSEVYSQYPSLAGKSLRRYVTNCTTFLPKDDIREGDWILSWKARSDGGVSSIRSISWIHTDLVVRRGAREDIYTTLAAQGPRPAPSEVPFELTPEVRRTFVELMKSERFASLRPTDSAWSLAAHRHASFEFLKALKKAAAVTSG